MCLIWHGLNNHLPARAWHSHKKEWVGRGQQMVTFHMTKLINQRAGTQVQRSRAPHTLCIHGGTQTHTCTHTLILHLWGHANTHTLTHICTHSPSPSASMGHANTHSRTYVPTNTVSCLHTHTHTHTLTYGHTHKNSHANTRTYTHTYGHTYICMHTNRLMTNTQIKHTLSHADTHTHTHTHKGAKSCQPPEALHAPVSRWAKVDDITVSPSVFPRDTATP